MTRGEKRKKALSVLITLREREGEVKAGMKAERFRLLARGTAIVNLRGPVPCR